MNKDKFVGICKVGEKGQIVIPKEARDNHLDFPVLGGQ